MNDIIYEIIRCNELEEFVHSSEYCSLEELPVTMHRALSLAQNPRSNPDDPALVLAYKNKILIGYVGLLPDILGGEKFYWNSGWWIKPGENAFAIQLFLKALKECDQKMLVTDMTPHTLSILQNLNFFYFGNDRIANKYILKTALAEILPVKMKWTGYLKPLLKIMDGLINTFVAFWQKILFETTQQLQVETLSSVPTEADNFISSFQKNELSKRQSPDFNWILKNRWILPEDEHTKKTKQAYYFSSFEPGFYQHALLFKSNEGEICGFVFLTIRKNNMRIDYLYADNKCVSVIADYLISYCLENKYRSVLTTDEALKTQLKKNHKLFIFRNKISMPLAISKKLKTLQPQNYQLQMGDGDVVFT